MKRIKTVFFAMLASLSLHGAANCLDARLTGVNFGGAEFNTKYLPGVFNKNYTYPVVADLAFAAAQGANVIRLPFRWERIQPTPGGPLNEDELDRIRATVEAAADERLCVILDVHNYAKYDGQTLGDNVKLREQFVQLWLMLAKEFPAPEKTIFGLMNEPAYMPMVAWTELAKTTLTALRNAKATNRILIGGGSWNGLHSWFAQSDGNSNATLLAGLKDPLNRTAIEVHQYADDNFSGTKTVCRGPDEFNARFDRITNWAAENNLQLFLGEFGVANNDVCLKTLERFLSLMTGPQWLGWTYWAAGRWWGTYPYALNNDAAALSAQWLILKPYFYYNLINPPKPPLPLSH